MQSEPALALLFLATMFSWPCAATIFVRDAGGPSVSFATMIASSVNISCFGLIFSQSGLMIGSLTATGAVVLGTMLRASAASVSIGLSVIFMGLYLCFCRQTGVSLL